MHCLHVAEGSRIQSCRSMILTRARDGNSLSRRSSESRHASRFGPKDIEKNQVVVVRRDNREKIVVSLDEIAETAKNP